MTRLNLIALRFLAVALAASLAPACSDQETDDGNGYHPVVMTDTDRDGIPDKCEAFFGTDPNDYDTDDDALADGSEDADGDGYTNHQEMVPYADKGLCPPEPDGGKEAAADVQAQDAAEDAGEDVVDKDVPLADGEADALTEAASEAASDAESTD